MTWLVSSEFLFERVAFLVLLIIRVFMSSSGSLSTPVFIGVGLNMIGIDAVWVDCIIVFRFDILF